MRNSSQRGFARSNFHRSELRETEKWNGTAEIQVLETETISS
jgi:hypothetical protein